MMPPTILFAFLMKRSLPHLTLTEALLLHKMAKENENEDDLRIAIHTMKSHMRCGRCGCYCQSVFAWRFPWWMVYVSYTLAILWSAWCTYYCISFGLQFQADTAQDWLRSVGISNALDIFVQQPVIVLLMAIRYLIFGERCGFCGTAMDFIGAVVVQ